MDIFLVLLGIIIFIVYLLIQLFIPVIILFPIFTQQEPIWLWSSILIIWFVTKMIVYIMKENN